MTTRRFPAPMLYGSPTPARWLRTLVAAIDQTAATLCCEQWQHGLLPHLQPVRIVPVARTARRVK